MDIINIILVFDLIGFDIIVAVRISFILGQKCFFCQVLPNEN